MNNNLITELKQLVKSIIKEENKIITEKLSIQDLAKSVYSLAKYNNGYFKSDKQGEFLKKEIDQNDGVIAYNEMYGNSTTVFAEYDDKGIIKIYSKSPKTNRETIKFQRISDKQFQDNKNKIETNIKNEKESVNKAIIDNLQANIDKLKNELINSNYANDPDTVKLFKQFPEAEAMFQKYIDEKQLELEKLENQLKDFKPY